MSLKEPKWVPGYTIHVIEDTEAVDYGQLGNVNLMGNGADGNPLV